MVINKYVERSPKFFVVLMFISAVTSGVTMAVMTNFRQLMTTPGNIRFLLVGLGMGACILFVLIATSFAEMLIWRQVENSKMIAYDRFVSSLFQTAVGLKLDDEGTVDGSAFTNKELESATQTLKDKALLGEQWYTVQWDSEGTVYVKRVQ